MRIAIDEITVGTRLRTLRAEKVAELVESIGRLGLQTPISVASSVDKCEGGADGVSFRLVAGQHRLEACKRLGHAEIDAFVVNMDRDERELWEIDENLCRADLTELERGEHLMRRKEIYERKWPETKRGANVGPQRQFVVTEQPSFAEDTASKAGLDQRTVQRVIKRAKDIDPKVRERVRALPELANSGVELDALGMLEPSQQRRAISMIESGTVGGVREARKIIAPPAPRLTIVKAPNVDDEVSALMALWGKTSQAAQERFLSEIGIAPHQVRVALS